MSKIGRKPIELAGVQVTVDGQSVQYKGPKASGVYVIPAELEAQVDGACLMLTVRDGSRRHNRVWGLHRALLSNKLKGAASEFEKQVRIVGLGFKAAATGSKIVFSLGFSHKIDFELPKEVSLSIDKTGQLLTFKSVDKELLGHVCSMVRALRKPEPYKGTGIRFENEVIARKAGKTKKS